MTDQSKNPGCGYKWPVIILAIVLTGCLTSRKADKQLSRIASEYPTKIATLARELYPCDTSRVDTVRSVNVVTIQRDTTLIDTVLIVDCLDSGPQPVRFKYGQIRVTENWLRTVTIERRVRDMAAEAVLQAQVKDAEESVFKAIGKFETWRTVAFIFIGLFILVAVLFYITKVSARSAGLPIYKGSPPPPIKE